MYINYNIVQNCREKITHTKRIQPGMKPSQRNRNTLEKHELSERKRKKKNEKFVKFVF